ncbi:MAG: hypothetical protein Ct9H300mP1_08840 [Planctomycetaceae bacterium]|nr:MAG: hypothetical protein Ct9H300mP1_08840 [Planctomycetaceae bacterium]
MRGHGNVTGADNVVSWSTGYPFGFHLGSGFPRFNPGEFTASDVLARGKGRRGVDHRQRSDVELQPAGPRSSRGHSQRGA